MITNETTTNTKNDEQRKVVCIRCLHPTNHIVIASATTRWSSDEDEISGMVDFEIIRCLGCDEVSFRTESSNSEDYTDYDDHRMREYDITEKLYPNRFKGRSSLDNQYYLPEKVKNVYSETYTALTSNMKILTSIGIRVLLEAVCLECLDEVEIKGKNLEKKIDNLVSKGVLTKANADTLHKTRLLGNKSAHEIVSPTDSELQIGFDIIENLLETIYIIPSKSESFGK